MVRRATLVSFILCLIAICALTERWAIASSKPDRLLCIHLPKNIDPGKLTMLSGGSFFSPVRTQAGVYDYTINLKYTSFLKLLLFCPGFKVVTAAFDANKVSSLEPYEPVFEASPVIPVDLRFTYTDGKPVANTRVVLRLGLSWPRDGRYVGFLGSTRGGGAELAKGFTDSNGRFAAEVPSLPDDPFFRNSVGYHVKLNLPYRYGSDLIPAAVPLKTSYPETVDIKVIYHGRIRGQISQAFMDRNKIPWPPTETGNNDRRMYTYVDVAVIADKREWNTGVQQDGRFNLSVEPGVYDFVVQAHEGMHHNKTRKVSVQSIDLKEGQDCEIEIN